MQQELQKGFVIIIDNLLPSSVMVQVKIDF